MSRFQGILPRPDIFPGRLRFILDSIYPVVHCLLQRHGYSKVSTQDIGEYQSTIGLGVLKWEQGKEFSTAFSAKKMKGLFNQE